MSGPAPRRRRRQSRARAALTASAWRSPSPGRCCTASCASGGPCARWGSGPTPGAWPTSPAALPLIDLGRREDFYFAAVGPPGQRPPDPVRLGAGELLGHTLQVHGLRTADRDRGVEDRDRNLRVVARLRECLASGDETQWKLR